MTLKPKVLDEMYSPLDKLYDGIDVQDGGLYQLGDGRAILISRVSLWLKGFHFPSENRISMYG